MGKRREDPSLAKIITGILLVGGAVLAIMRFADWFGGDVAGNTGEAEASTDDRLNRAKSLIDAGDHEAAKPLLDEIIKGPAQPTATPGALMLQARLEVAGGNPSGAKDFYARITKEFAASPEAPEARLRFARILEDEGKVAEALAIYAEMADSAPPAARPLAWCGLARDHLRKEELLEARDLYRKAVAEAAWGSPIWEEAADGLGDVNVKAIFSPMPTPESKFYEVQAGDTLVNIGITLNTTQGLLMAANGMSDPNRLRPGQRLKYTPKDFRIVIERATCRLYLFDGDGLFRVYPVGLGKKYYETTIGRYKIGNKEKDPTWFKPGSDPIPPGDPRNELGTRWMPLVPEEAGLPKDLGIHGTIQPDSIGKYESMGCPRMHNADAEELFDLVVRSTPVSIVERFDPARIEHP